MKQPPWIDHDFPAIPKRTRLVALEPIGVGGPDVESLSSYLVRLAAAHCVSPRDLVRRVMPEASANLPRLDAAFFRNHGHTISGLGRYAETFSSGLQTLTGRGDLDRLTLLPLRQLLPVNGSSLLYPRPCWCSSCLDHHAFGTVKPYRKLLWKMSLYRVCHVHYVRLVDACGHCRRRQPTLPRQPSLLLCDYCGKHLSFAECTPVPLKSGQCQTAANLADLIASPTLVGAPVSLPTLLSSLNRFVERGAHGNRAAWCRAHGFQPRLLNNWINRGQHPSLQQILRLCRALNLPPSGLLAGAASQAIAVSPSRRQKKARKRYVPINVRRQVSTYLADDGCSLKSLAKIAAKFHVSRSYLAYWFPKRLAERFDRRERERADRRNARERARAVAVREVLEALLRAHARASRRHVEKELVARGFSMREGKTRVIVKAIQHQAQGRAQTEQGSSA